MGQAVERHGLSERVGELLWLWRRYLKVTQKVAAARAGVSQHYWSRIEKGSYNIQLYSLERIIWSLELSWEAFFAGPPKRTERNTFVDYSVDVVIPRSSGKHPWEDYFGI